MATDTGNVNTSTAASGFGGFSFGVAVDGAGNPVDGSGCLDHGFALKWGLRFPRQLYRLGILPDVP
uniref:Uncharacterized protein n=1 Tax=Oryza sativa subsp. japonica TaxID=39947 RepID=Q6Z5J3_ORYSJ|nr:hypothetical protein [Oryza sativa Japonica Group]